MSHDSILGFVVKRRVASQALAQMREMGNYELFVIGLTEVGVLGGKEWWWDCELFQIGLRELGLA
jgi:hypothetical protein